MSPCQRGRAGSRALLRAALAAGLFTSSLTPASAQGRLNPEAVRRFDAFSARVEESMTDRASGAAPFLWLSEDRTRVRAAEQGRLVIERLGANPELDGAMVHNWIGGVFVPGVTVDDVLSVFLDYDRYPDIYPGVEASRLLGREGDTQKLYQRLRRGNVVLDTWHDAGYSKLDGERVVTWSRSTEIREVENAGQPDEELLPIGEDRGYMWRLYVYWRLEQTDDGVFAECHSISLSRRVPFLLRWLVAPFIRNIPRQGMERSLEATRAEAWKLAAARSEVAN